MTAALLSGFGALAQALHRRTVSNKSDHFTTDGQKASAIVLKALAVALPLIGWLLAFSNLFGGVFWLLLLVAVHSNRAQTAFTRGVRNKTSACVIT